MLEAFSRPRPFGEVNRAAFDANVPGGAGKEKRIPGRSPFFNRYINSSGQEVYARSLQYGEPDAASQIFALSLQRRFEQRAAREQAGEVTPLAQEQYPASVIYNEIQADMQRAIDAGYSEIERYGQIADAFLALTFTSDKFSPEYKRDIVVQLANSFRVEGLVPNYLDAEIERAPGAPLYALTANANEVYLNPQQAKVVKMLVEMAGLEYISFPHTFYGGQQAESVAPTWEFSREVEQIYRNEISDLPRRRAEENKGFPYVFTPSKPPPEQPEQ